jgi:excisionase family DNA binding protein
MKDYYTVSEACEILSLTRQRISAIIKSGQLKGCTRVSTLWLIPHQSLKAFQQLDRPDGVSIARRKKC